MTTRRVRLLILGLGLPLVAPVADGGGWVLMLAPHHGRGWTVHAVTDTAAECEEEKRKFIQWFAGLLDEQQAPGEVWEREFTWAAGAQCVPARSVTGYMSLAHARQDWQTPVAESAGAA